MTDHVLVVDDSYENRLVACGHLEAGGFRVTAVASGEAALELLGRTAVDLVLLDVMMPGIDGYEVCRRIRACEQSRATPVLFLTALGDVETTAPALASGADDVLSKPFHPAELLLRVRALIRLKRTTSELQTFVERMRRINALVIHDLKSPLTAILHNAQCLDESAQVVAADREVVGDILIAINHLQRTVHDLLDVARSDDGTLAASPSPFDLAEVATGVATMLRGLARGNDVEIAVQAAVPHIVADREMVRRMLENLVSNALKHAPQGSTVEIEAVAEADAVRVGVHDAGPGVPLALRERIFDRYVSLDGHGGARAGDGLGLAFCRLAAEAHGGRIWIEDRAPAGASFWIRLPQPPRRAAGS